MKELEMILRNAAQQYPKMQPTDAVKLIYQNEFGGGHLIRNEEVCRNYLRREYAAVTKDAAVPLYEDIGNGIVRVNLAAVAEAELDWLGTVFIQSASEHTGNSDNFRNKLDVLRRLTREGIFAFSPAALQDYLIAYESAGFPAVSHSQQYRDAYRPAYRIILKKYCK